VYLDESGAPIDFYPVALSELEESCTVRHFDDLSSAMEFYFGKKESSNQGRQKSHDLIRAVNALLDKMYLKKKRLSEDLLKAENSTLRGAFDRKHSLDSARHEVRGSHQLL